MLVVQQTRWCSRPCCPAAVMRLQLVLLTAALLLLAAVAAAPVVSPSAPRQPAAAGNVRGRPSTLVAPTADALAARECPGIEADGTVCAKACQLRLCRAFAVIYKISNNLTDPWDNERGWQATATVPCERLTAGTPRQATYCSWFGVTCCTPDAMRAGECSAVNTVMALDLPINNLNVSLENPQLLPNLKVLHDCGMRVLNLEANNIIGALSDDWGQLNKLTVFNFGNNWIATTIPNGLRRLRNVTLINLSNNWVAGTLPQWLTELTELRVLNLGSNQGGNDGVLNEAGDPVLGIMGSIPPQIGRLTKLRELNLEANALTGELPERICAGDNSSLLLLNLRGNKLEGGASVVEDCGNLVQLDISQNSFTGRLPSSTDWDELATYRAANNKFSGRFPMNLTTARILEHLDISNNQLTGIIPHQVTLLSSIKTFVVSSNRFSGTVTENIYYLPALAKLDLSNNTLVGTTPQAVGLAYGLSELDISNNPGLTGMLPPQMGLLSRLKMVRTTGTNLSCAGVIQPYQITTNNSCSDPDRCTSPTTVGTADTRFHQCGRDALVPCFLRFSDYMIPRDDDSNMRCKYIVRRPADEARRVCGGASDTGLGDQSSQLPDLGTDRLQQLWHVDPSYFQYQVCECLLGYKGVWDANSTLLRCDPVGQQTPTAIIVGVVAAAAVLIIGLLALCQYLTTRPRWLRERILQAKRSRGAPKASKPGDKVTVSIVVTDVKDFSDLTRQYPEQMNKAMGIHNNILRKASHNHAGYIMDQEGDSWTVAFHDAEDAVAFSLQIQQALAQRSWGKLRAVSQHEFSDLATMRDGVFSTRFSHTHQSSLTSAVRQSSSSFGLMGEESFTAGQGLQDGVVQGGRMNASFSSGGRNSTGGGPGDRSFSLRMGPPSEDDNNPSAQLPLSPLPNGPSSKGGAGGAAADTSKHSARGDNGQQQQHQPDQRQVSFSDTAGMSRDASPFYRTAQQQQQQVLQLLHCNSEENLVQQSGISGNWTGVTRGGYASPAPAIKRSFDSAHPPVPDSRMNSLSITVASRSRTSGSGSRLWSAGAAVVRRFSVFGRSGLLSSSTQAAGDTPHQHHLHLSVRIGVATGTLPYGCDLNNCGVKDRAKNFVSEVANGGQILLDENTFKAIKDSLSVLGTVNESGYDDRQLQQLLHNQVVNRLQHHICCGTCATCACSSCRVGQREASFSSAVQNRDIQDYDNDALVVHMGAFEPPAQAVHQRKHTEAPGATSDSSLPSTPASEDEARDTAGPLAGKDVAAAGGDGGEAAGGRGVSDSKGKRTIVLRKAKVLQLYAVAAPGMRRVPNTTQDMAQCLSWGAAVAIKPKWTKVQKGYFDAPGARQMDLAPTAQTDQAPLPEVVIVFAQVVGGTSFGYKRNRSESHALKKAIKRCMLQMLSELPEQEDGRRDGYLCRCQEADLKYMIAFSTPVAALQWCMLVQEALMYFNWPDNILSHPGFEEVLDPITGLPLFRGPRLRMGFAAGQPNSVLPDHTGRANYYGHSVNRAARFMEAAAHAGQIVTDVDTARALFNIWQRECVMDGVDSGAPSRAHSDADVQQTDSRQDMANDAALLQMLASRSLSETAGHCRPSAIRMPLSRVALRQQQQSNLQQLQMTQLQSRDNRQLLRQRPGQQDAQTQPPSQQQQGQQGQQAPNQPVNAAGRDWPYSSPLPDVVSPHAQLEQLPEVTPTNSATAAAGQSAQQRPGGLSVEPTPGSFTRRLQLSGSGGSFTQQQVAASGGSFTRQQQLVAGSGGSFTRQQIAGSSGSFTRQQQVAGSGGSFTRRQQLAAVGGMQVSGTSMSASFSARRGGAPAAPSTGAAIQPYGVQQSAASFVLQVPVGWQSLETCDVVECVTASYLGTFSFKGSGVYDMVHILPSSLSGRQFPEEAPKGKGYRVMPAEGPVVGMDPVSFSIPPRLVAARQAFLSSRMAAAASSSADAAAGKQQE